MDAAYLIGRQPILDKDGRIYAYEIVFHAMDTAQTCPADGVSSRIIDFLANNGAQEILGERKGVIEIGIDILMDDALLNYSVNGITLSIKKSVPLTSAVIERCLRLKESGFSLALDNHEYHHELAELYTRIDFMRIDLDQISPSGLMTVTKECRHHHIHLLARKVETRKQLADCQALEFDLFQGQFIIQPSTSKKKKLEETTSSLLRILHLIMKDAEVDAIVHTFEESPALTYKLLLQANSALVGSRREIESVRHAVSLLGRDQIRRWAQSEILSASGDSQGDNPLVEMATFRASFMEYLSKSHPMLRGFKDAADRAFLVGTLSMMEIIYNVSIDDVVKSVELSSDVNSALLRRAGLFGYMLLFIEAIERLDFDAAREILPKIKMSPVQILDSQRKAFLWNKN